MNELEQECPECGSYNYVNAKVQGLLECLECGEMFDDEEEQLASLRRHIKKKQRREDDDE